MVNLPEAPKGYKWDWYSMRGPNKNTYVIVVSLYKTKWGFLHTLVEVKAKVYLGPETFKELEDWAGDLIDSLNKEKEQ